MKDMLVLHGNIECHVHIYNKKSLHTPDIMKNERIWKNIHYEYRSIWLDVRDERASEDNHNEAIAIIKEIEKFCALL